MRQFKHKRVQVVRGDSIYLRLNLPESKRHDLPKVTLRPAFQVCESLMAQAQKQGLDSPEDDVFLSGEIDRGYALAVMGFWFRLLDGQGIDMLPLVRNARTSVQMIERLYASALDGEMNVGMLQSRRTLKH